VTKRICGVMHEQVKCRECGGLCWTRIGLSAELKPLYTCATCSEPRPPLPYRKGSYVTEAQYHGRRSLVQL
jgi:hypothetical protein